MAHIGVGAGGHHLVPSFLLHFHHRRGVAILLQHLPGNPDAETKQDRSEDLQRDRHAGPAEPAVEPHEHVPAEPKRQEGAHQELVLGSCSRWKGGRMRSLRSSGSWRQSQANPQKLATAMMARNTQAPGQRTVPAGKNSISAKAPSHRKARKPRRAGLPSVVSERAAVMMLLIVLEIGVIARRSFTMAGARQAPLVKLTPPP